MATGWMVRMLNKDHSNLHVKCILGFFLKARMVFVCLRASDNMFKYVFTNVSNTLLTHWKFLKLWSYFILVSCICSRCWFVFIRLDWSMHVHTAHLTLIQQDLYVWVIDIALYSAYAMHLTTLFFVQWLKASKCVHANFPIKRYCIIGKGN